MLEDIFFLEAIIENNVGNPSLVFLKNSVYFIW